MLSGCYMHSVDEKNRISLPARLRKAMPESFVLTKGPDGCLWALAHEQWSVIVERSEGSLEIQRFFVASACECVPGAKGRFLLPDSLRKHAEIKSGGEVAIVGFGNRIEIWSARRWESVSSQISREHIHQKLPEFFSRAI